MGTGERTGEGTGEGEGFEKLLRPYEDGVDGIEFAVVILENCENSPAPKPLGPENGSLPKSELESKAA